MTVAEMLFIITKIMVKRAFYDNIISSEEYTNYDLRFREIEEEEEEE